MSDMLRDAGRLVSHSSMVWIRKLDVPHSAVWEAVSTKKGLDRWWMAPVEIELRPGGKFSHHWENTISDLKEHYFIHFVNDSFDSRGMRFELKPTSSGTLFNFIDSWAEDAVPEKSLLPPDANGIDIIQPGGPGTPWSGMAAGWHDSIDKLESYLTRKKYDHSYEDLCKFYAGYLADYYRWFEIMAVMQHSK